MQKFKIYKRIIINNKKRVLFKKPNSRKAYIKYKKQFIEYAFFKKLQTNKTHNKLGGSGKQNRTAKRYRETVSQSWVESDEQQNKKQKNSLWKTIEQMYSNNGLSAPLVFENRWLELLEMGLVKNENASNEVKYIAVALTNMMMCTEWNEAIINTCSTDIQEVFRTLNGLHLKYLKNAHIIGKFTKNNETFVFSHAGIPPVLRIKEDTEPYTDVSIDKMILSIDTLKNKLLQPYINISTLDKYMSVWKHLASEAFINDDEELKNIHRRESFRSKYDFFSPIVYNKETNIVNSDILKTGGSSQLYKFKSTDITYNIFGHKPQGMFPIAIQKNQTTHICLDISVMNNESYLNKGNYALMHIIDNQGNNNIHMRGRIMFGDTKKNINSPIDVILDEPLIYNKSLLDYIIKYEDAQKMYTVDTSSDTSSEQIITKLINIQYFDYKNMKLKFDFRFIDAFIPICTITKDMRSTGGRNAKKPKKHKPVTRKLTTS